MAEDTVLNIICVSPATRPVTAGPAPPSRFVLSRRPQAPARLFVLGRDRKRYGAPQPRGKIEGLGEHQPVVRLRRGGVLRREAHREAVQPLFGFLAHGAAQLSESDIARRVASQKVDAPRRIGRVTLAR